MTLWIKVSRDEYELPLVVADSLDELAEICGVNKYSIIQMMSRAKHQKYLKWTCYRKAEVDDEVSEM